MRSRMAFFETDAESKRSPRPRQPQLSRTKSWARPPPVGQLRPVSEKEKVENAPARNMLIETMREHIEKKRTCTRSELESMCAQISSADASDAYKFLATLYGNHPFDQASVQTFIDCFVDVGTFSTHLGDAICIADVALRQTKWDDEQKEWESLSTQQLAVRDKHRQRAAQKCASRELNKHAFDDFTRLYDHSPVHQLPKWMLVIVTPVKHTLYLPKTFWFDVSLKRVENACVRAFVHRVREIESHIGSAAVPGAVRATWDYHEALLEGQTPSCEEIEASIRTFLVENFSIKEEECSTDCAATEAAAMPCAAADAIGEESDVRSVLLEEAEASPDRSDDRADDRGRSNGRNEREPSAPTVDDPPQASKRHTGLWWLWTCFRSQDDVVAQSDSAPSRPSHNPRSTAIVPKRRTKRDPMVLYYD